MSTSPEILVHISAASRASDDARYRRELHSFLDFQPAHRHSLSSKGPDYELNSEYGEYGDALEQVADASFCSSSDPTSGPRSKPHSATSRLITPAPAALRDPRFLLSKTPALVPGTTAHKPFYKIPALVSPQRRPRTAPDSLNGSTGIQETPLLRHTQSDSWKTPPSVIPDSQPTQYTQKRLPPSSSPSPTRSSSPTTRKRQRLVSPPALPLVDIGNDDDGDYASSTPPPPALPAPSSSEYAGDVETSSTPGALVRFTPHEPASPTPIAAQNPLLPSQFAPSSWVIRAPRPGVSTQTFQTHITRNLAELTGRLPLSQIYTPQILSQTRPLDVSERGHWLIKLSKFSADQKTRFWEFLKEHIGKGLAGFGVSCFLEMTRVNGANETGNDNASQEGIVAGGTPQEDRELVAKIYCWGEIVGEIWNVLFIAGHRQIKEIGTCWIDAENKVVVRMK